jgi:L-rhamnose mutarotase
MERVCFTMHVRPGYEDEYKRRHDEIWPALRQEIIDAGFRNYSIWRYGLLLIAYFETDDFKRSVAQIGKSANSAKWSSWFAPILQMEIDPATGFPYKLPCVWLLDESPQQPEKIHET